MADGMRERSGADVSVAITGIAGPGGGSPEKPVGTVVIAVLAPGTADVDPDAFLPGRPRSRQLSGNAGRARHRASPAAVDVRLFVGAEPSAARPARGGRDRGGATQRPGSEAGPAQVPLGPAGKPSSHGVVSRRGHRRSEVPAFSTRLPQRLPRNRSASHLSGLGTFPPSGSPRVLWMGVVEGLDALARVHDEVAIAAGALGIPEGVPPVLRPPHSCASEGAAARRGEGGAARRPHEVSGRCRLAAGSRP